MNEGEGQIDYLLIEMSIDDVLASLGSRAIESRLEKHEPIDHEAAAKKSWRGISSI